MSRGGLGASVLLMAREAAENPKARPRRRRELGLQALDHLWSRRAPPPGSRVVAFKRAWREVVTGAAEIGVEGATFDQWAEKLRFQVDDRDDDDPWLSNPGETA